MAMDAWREVYRQIRLQNAPHRFYPFLWSLADLEDLGTKGEDLPVAFVPEATLDE
jgi:hypothetical protein